MWGSEYVARVRIETVRETKAPSGDVAGSRESEGIVKTAKNLACLLFNARSIMVYIKLTESKNRRIRPGHNRI